VLRRRARRVVLALSWAVSARQARILRMLAAIRSSAVNREQAAMPRTRRRAGWLGEGVVGGVFGVAVEPFDGVPQGGVAGLPGWAAVGQVLAVAGACVGRDGDRGLPADPRWFFGRLELGFPS
jgi:hypothetical protein